MFRSALAALAALMMAHPIASAAGESSGSRAVINLPDGRLLALVGGGSQSLSSVNGVQHIVADGIVIDLSADGLTVSGEARELPAFERMLEIRIINGEVKLVGDP